MLSQSPPPAAVCLTDVTLTTIDWQRFSPSRLRRLYTALLDTGVRVQIPAPMAGMLGSHLLAERTVPVREGRERISDGNTRLYADTSLFLQDYTATFKRFMRRAPGPAFLSVRGDASLAAALTVSWFQLGGADAAVSMMGAGGHVPLAEVMMALVLHGSAVFQTQALRAAAAAWETLTGLSVPPYQPVIGARIFDVSSGIHIDGLLKDPESYEPFPPETVSRQRRIVLDQHAGQSAVAARLKALDVDPGRVDLRGLTERVRAIGFTSGEIGEAAFAALAHEAAGL